MKKINKIVIGTHNSGKFKEIHDLLPKNLIKLSPKEFNISSPEETGSSFEENSNLNLLKNIKIFYKTKNELDRLCSKDQISHQGLIAEIEHLDHISIKDYIKLNEHKRNMTFVALTTANLDLESSRSSVITLQ